MINISHMKLWLKALRSGEFRQAQNQLRDDRKFCCLGVACEVFRRTTGLGRWRAGVFIIDDFRESSTLPGPVQIWLGIRKTNPLLEYPDTAASLNDSGVPFSEIANSLERVYLRPALAERKKGK